MTRKDLGLALLALAAASLTSGCGAGVAGVAASSGGSSGGGSPPAIVNLSLAETKRAPARIEFELQNASAEVELRYHRPGDPSGTFTRMEHVSVLPANPTVLAPGRATADWTFTAEPGIDPAGGFDSEVEIEVAIVGQSSGSQRAGAGVGNDLPRITSAAADVDPLAGEVSGIVLVTATLEDTPGDRANLRVEFSLDGTSWNVARPAQNDTTPPFAFTNVVAELGGTEVAFFWDTAEDLGDADTDALIRFTPFEDVEGTLEQGTLLASTPFHLDNNAAPIVQLFNDAVISNPDERRGIPVPFRVFDEEGDRVETIFQWRREGEEFPELLESEIDAVLADPVLRREKHICTEYPRFAHGLVVPIDATTVRLPELARSESWILASGLVGRTLELLRPSSTPEPITPTWPSNPLVSPIAALPVGDGLTALVLDAPGNGRIREIELATGAIVREIATLGPGAPSAMALERGEKAVLVATDLSGIWRIERVELASGAITELIVSDGSQPGPVRGIASLGTNAAVFTAGSSLFTLDYRDPLAPQLGTLLSELATPWGVVVDPLPPGRLYLAEREAFTAGGTGRILAVELDSLGRLPVVVRTEDLQPAHLERPSALALERNGSRMLIVTNEPGSGSQLVGLDLGAQGKNVSFPIGPRRASEIASIANGPEELRCAALPGEHELHIGGGLEQRRVIVAYESAGQQATLEVALHPEARPVRPWRIRADPRKQLASPTGFEATFGWSSGEDIGGGPAFLRAIARDDELGLPTEGRPRSRCEPRWT